MIPPRGVLLAFALIAANARGTEVGMTHLDALLHEVNPTAVQETGLLGDAALPLLRKTSHDSDYRVRQLTMHCAAAIADGKGAEVLALGLTDDNLNVQVAAVNELAKKAYPGATAAILRQLAASGDDLVREQLALAAGYLPGPKSRGALRKLVDGSSRLGANAKMALARLGDADGRRALQSELRSHLARTRYEALEKLIYVQDQTFLAAARSMLRDHAEAMRVGIVERPRYRRVCDQAADTLASLLGVAPGFQLSEDKIYSHAEIATMQELARHKIRATE